MRASSLALGVALAASAADAQTVISREISPQPVETVVTQGPYGTTITRRPVAPAELADTYAPGTFVRQPLNLAPSYEPSFRPPAPIPGQVVTQPAPVVAQEAPAVERVTIAPPVRREVVTTTTVAPALPPPAYVERRYDVPTTAYVERRYEQPWWERRWEQPVYNTATYPDTYRNTYQNTWRAPVLAADDEAVVTTPVVARTSVYAIGTMLPAGVPLYSVPESLTYRVPALRPYRYAYLGEQVYLVDPLSNVIVAVVTE